MASLKEILKQNNYPEDFIAKIPDYLLSFDELTTAETLLLTECRNGYVDCFIPQYAIVARGDNDFEDSLIRSEILQWMLLSPFSETFFPNKKIVIRNAIVDNFFESREVNELNNYVKDSNSKFRFIHDLGDYKN
jgi:hypothetical protein